VKLLKSKDQSLEAFKIFKVVIKNETKRKIKGLKFENEGEYTPPKSLINLQKCWNKKGNELNILTLL
jgi:hypothetical protein